MSSIELIGDQDLEMYDEARVMKVPKETKDCCIQRSAKRQSSKGSSSRSDHTRLRSGRKGYFPHEMLSLLHRTSYREQLASMDLTERPVLTCIRDCATLARWRLKHHCVDDDAYDEEVCSIAEGRGSTQLLGASIVVQTSESHRVRGLIV